MLLVFILICTLGNVCNAVFHIRINGSYTEAYNLKINRSIEYIFDFQTSTYPVRIVTSSENAMKTNPLLIVVQQEKRISSWQVPFMFNSDMAITYPRAGHILCPNILKDMPTATMLSRRHMPEVQMHPHVYIKSSSNYNITFMLQATQQKEFFLHSKEERYETISISEPMYYYYNFHDPGNEADKSGAILLTVESDSATCMIVSVQNSTCPVFDLENNVKFNSYWQTMNYKAAMVILKNNYPHGFYVVMTVKQYDNDCTDTKEKVSHNIHRKKNVKFSIQPTITLRQHYMIFGATLGIFGGVFLICIVSAIVYLVVHFSKERKIAKDTETDGVEGSQINLRRQLLMASKTSIESRNYFWHVGIVALFYSIPVLQLVLTYQGILHDTGNEDLCYYNFLCAHPFGFISDFNHVFSNIGYILFGILFFIVTYIKELQERIRCRQGYGLPKPFGMYKALAFALIMEGILSGCYHICPKASNFQFDTSFMYVMTVLMTVNIYESRHTSGDTRGYFVFGMLAGATTLSVLGSYFNKTVTFWIIFTIIHIVLCVVLTWILDKSVVMKVFKCTGKLEQVQIYRLIFWILGNIINIGLAIFGFIQRESFATHLLMILIVNCLFYLLFYICMKMYYKEKILVVTWILIVVDTLVWICALYFFVTKVTSWEVSPAESRSFNQICKIASYYDNHDIWHFLSSIALFVSFIILLTLDDGLTKVRQSTIPDFHGH